MNERTMLLLLGLAAHGCGEAASEANPAGTTGDQPESMTSSGASSSGSTSGGEGSESTTGLLDPQDPVDPTEETGTGETGTDEVPSRCEVTALTVTCTHHSETVFTGLTGISPREVHWQVPLGEAPPSGWPVAILFQGSLFTAETFWVVLQSDSLGMRHQGLLTKSLLDAGFAVVTPEAHLGGFTAWETNVPPMSELWEASADHQFMLDIFEAIEQEDFGPLDTRRMYAAGISSGGYMTSRMDLAYRDRFRALAIQSASWATCVGPVCQVPEMDPAHLPTLFLHGEVDDIVPVETMLAYRNALDVVGVETKTIVDPGVDHAWLPEAPEEITGWFEAH